MTFRHGSAPDLLPASLRRGRRCGRAALVAALLVVVAAPGAAAAEAAASSSASEPSLEEFLDGMARTPGVVARFREVKEIGLLSVPLEVRGTLWFVPPDRFARVTTEPSRTRLVIDGDRFTFRDAAGSDTVDLAASPVAREFVENFIVLFGGDPDALRARYEPTLHVEGEAWRLVLRPRHRPLADLVERVTLAGEGRRLARLELLEADGDRTTTFLEDVEVDRRFTPEELERIFAPPGDGPEPSGEAAGDR